MPCRWNIATPRLNRTNICLDLAEKIFETSDIYQDRPIYIPIFRCYLKSSRSTLIIQRSIGENRGANKYVKNADNLWTFPVSKHGKSSKNIFGTSYKCPQAYRSRSDLNFSVFLSNRRRLCVKYLGYCLINLFPTFPCARSKRESPVRSSIKVVQVEQIFFDTRLLRLYLGGRSVVKSKS